MTDDDGRRYARQLWCVYCLAEVGGRADSLAAYMQHVVRYSAGIDTCPECGKTSEPLSDTAYFEALRVLLDALLKRHTGQARDSNGGK